MNRAISAAALAALLAGCMMGEGVDDDEIDELAAEILQDDDDGYTAVHRPIGYVEQASSHCTPGVTMKVKWRDIAVCRTPNDPGSYEEWKSRVSIGTSFPLKTDLMKRAHEPPDNLALPLGDPWGSCWTHQVGKVRYFNDIAPIDTLVWAHHYGYESDDDYFNPSDPIPDYSDVVPLANCVGNAVSINQCGWDPAYRRYSCTRVEFTIQ